MQNADLPTCEKKSELNKYTDLIGTPFKKYVSFEPILGEIIVCNPGFPSNNTFTTGIGTSPQKLIMNRITILLNPWSL